MKGRGAKVRSVRPESQIDALCFSPAARTKRKLIDGQAGAAGSPEAGAPSSGDDGAASGMTASREALPATPASVAA